MYKGIFNFHVPGIHFEHAVDFHPPKDKFKAHTHDMIEINYFISGKARFVVEGNIYKRKPGDLLILRPAETHMPLIESSDPYERITMHISPSYLAQISPYSDQLLIPFFERELGTYNQYDSSQFRSKHWKDCLYSIAENARMSFEEKAYVDSNFISFLNELYLAYSKRDLKSEQIKTDDLSINIIQYINNHLFDSISVGSMSEHFHISTAHMNRLFRKATGTSIWKYVLTKRLLAARVKIQSGVSPQTVCFECGFNDYSTFFRAYKSHFSLSPKDDYKNEGQ